jgi:hypothetical protein
MPSINVLAHYMTGLGFEGMLSNAPPKNQMAIHLLALLGVWRLNHKTIEWPTWLQQENQTIENNGLNAQELVFISQVEALLEELIHHGLAHLSSLSTQRLHAFNMSARAVALPRLVPIFSRWRDGHRAH